MNRKKRNYHKPRHLHVNVVNKEACDKAYEEFEREYDLVKNVPDAIWGGGPYIRPEPPKRTLIHGYGKDISARRFPYYSKDFIERMEALAESDEEEYTKFVRKEWERRKEGFWFFNGNKLEYITGHHYCTLQYWTIPGIREGMNRPGRVQPSFRDIQRDIFYCFDQMRNDPKCAGIMLLSFRRLGKTAMVLAEGYWDSTENAESVFPIQSKTEDDSKKMFAKLIDSWKHVPVWFKPMDDGSSTQMKKLVFAEGKKRSTAIDRTYKEVLNSKIYYVPSTEVSVDGDYVSFFYRDEFAKSAKNINIEEAWYVTKETMFMGSVLVGKAVLSSTVEDQEKYGSASAKKLWDASDTSNRLSDGFTQSGLYQLFLPAYYGYIGEDGVGDRFVDECGYSNLDVAKKYHLKLQEDMEGDKLLSQKRKYPITIKDAWILDERTNSFSTRKLIEQNIFIDSGGSQQVVRGNFMWKNGVRDTEVVWYPDDIEGKWEVSFMPEPGDRNRYEMMGTSRRPTREFAFLGVDPFSHKATVDHGSNGAGITCVKSYPLHQIKEGVACVYNFRPEDPNIFADDMIKQAMFYSSMIFAERNTYGFQQQLQARGYSGFLLKNVLEKDPKKMSKDDYGFPNTSPGMREALLDMLASYIVDIFGKDADGNYGWMHFDQLIRQLIDFDVNKWTKYDLVVALGLSVAAMRSPKIQMHQGYTAQDWFPVYKKRPKDR